jgi:hypothetical protein
MIRIRHSDKPYEELEVEGSASEFSELRSAILSFCEAAETSTDVPADSEFDPSPCQQKLGRLRICKTGDLLLISVSGGLLFISGKPRFLRLFADNLPSGPDRKTNVPYHAHFDRLGQAERISEASLDIVLTIK